MLLSEKCVGKRLFDHFVILLCVNVFFIFLPGRGTKKNIVRRNQKKFVSKSLKLDD